MQRKLKKIGIVSEYYYPHLGGITEHVYFFSKELAKRGYEVVVITGYQGETSEMEPFPGVRVVNFAKSMPVYSNGSIAKISYGWKLAKKVKAFLEKENFDLIHYHNPFVPILPPLFLKYSQAINIGTFHTYFKSNIFVTLFHKMIQGFMDKLDGAIAVSQSCIDTLNRYLSCDFEVIGNGVDVEWFSHPVEPFYLKQENSLNISFLGRLDPRNGLEHLIQAFFHVVKQEPRARLLIAGDGPLRGYYEEMSGDLLNQKIFFVGSLLKNRPSYLAQSDVFCYPALIASFGIALIEAMSAGTPVIAHDNEGFRTVVRSGENGLLVDCTNHQGFADSILQVLSQKELADQLSKEGRKTAENFSWTRITDSVLAFYERAFEKRQKIRLAS